MTDQVTALLRGQITSIAVGSIFLFVGLATCAIAAFRRGRGVRTFVWLGVWSAMYGALKLGRSAAVMTASPPWLQIGVRYADGAIAYLIVVAGALSFLDLSRGRFRRLVQATTVIGVAIAVGGAFTVVFTNSSGMWPLFNNLLVTAILLAVVCENAAEAGSLDNRRIRPNRRRPCSPGTRPNLMAHDPESAAPCMGRGSRAPLRHGLAASSARLRRSPRRRLGQPAATGGH